VAGISDQGKWLPIYDGSSIRSAHQNEGINNLYMFHANCLVSFELMQDKKFVEGRKVLSGACSALHHVIRAGHLETLNYLLSTFSVLIRGIFGQLNDVLNLLRGYIGQVAIAVLPENHPWRTICYLLAKIDRKGLDQAINLAVGYLGDVWLRKNVRQVHVLGFMASVGDF